MTWLLAPRTLAALLAALWVAAGVGGTTSYGLGYWYHRGFTAPKYAPGVQHGRAVTVHFHSTALGRKDSYIAYLPPGYAAAARAGKRFPVLYLLHGSPGSASLLLDVSGIPHMADTMLHRHQLRPMIIVAPNANDGTFHNDTEWADTPHGAYGSAVIDVVHNVDARFATLADRGHRAIAGLSEGGYGAVNLLLQHLKLFSVAESWSGYFVQTPTGPFAKATRAQVAAQSPLYEVASMRRAIARRPVHVLLYTGMHDKHFAASAFGPFGTALQQAGGDVTSRMFHGGHTWALWRRQAPFALRYGNAKLAP